MKTFTFTFIIEKWKDTGLFIGTVRNIPGAHSQGKTLEELQIHMKEVLELILDEPIEAESEFIGTQVIQVG
jgi:predicted RNase H-like HicB family nuclease